MAHLMSREMTRARGRPRKGAELDEHKLLGAALDVFAEHGFDKASLRAIAGVANVDVALISYRYGSKLGLWKAMIEAFSRELVAALAPMRIERTDLSSAGRLNLAIDQLIAIACGNPQFARFIVKELANVEQSEHLEHLHHALTEPVHEVLVPLIEGAHREAGEGNFDADFAFFAALGAMAMTLSTRKFIARFSSAAADDDQMRERLGAVMRAILFP
jgi:AcrR family transcriptional regulator